MPELLLTQLTAQDASEIAGWRYEAPYDTYDVGPQDAQRMNEPAQRFSAVRRDGELVAYVCLGAEARVPGLDAEPGTEDLGFGLRPDLMGQGLSRVLLPWLLAELGKQLIRERLRVVILEWNARSLAAYRRVGFTDAGTHATDAGTFILLTRPAPKRVSQ